MQTGDPHPRPVAAARLAATLGQDERRSDGLPSERFLTVIFLIGDMTGLIGDPTGRNTARPPMTRPEIDQHGGGGTPPADFEVDRALLLHLVERFTAKLPDFKFAPHPMFLEMNEREWMRWGYLHSDHHLRQFGV